MDIFQYAYQISLMQVSNKNSCYWFWKTTLHRCKVIMHVRSFLLISLKANIKLFFIKNYPLIEDVIFAWIFFLSDSYYKLKTSWLSDLKPFFSIETFCVFILNTNANTRYWNSFKITLGKTNVPLFLFKIYHKTLLI